MIYYSLRINETSEMSHLGLDSECLVLDKYSQVVMISKILLPVTDHLLPMIVI